MVKFYTRGLIACLSLISLASCQDHDAGFTEADVKKGLYSKNFEKTFGKVDPNQDWSMASLVTANLNVGSGATAYVYTEKPGHKGSSLAGIVTGSSAQFNLIKGAKQVYVMVEDGDQYTVSGYFNVVNGVINITSTPVSKAMNSTRAGASYSVGDRLFTQTAYSKNADWDGETYILNSSQYFCIRKEGSEYYLWYKTSPEGTFRKLAHNSTEDGNICGYWWNTSAVKYADDGTEALSLYWFNLIEKNSNGELVFKDGIQKYTTRQSWDATYYKIEGDTKADDVEWVVGDCANLFWNGDAVFLEGQNYKTTQHKLDAYAKYNTTVEEMEQGVVVVTTKNNARVDIPMMFGATLNANIFGYYYYTNEQDALTANRYVLYEDAKPSSNIKVDGVAVGDMDLQSKQSTWTRNSIATCTNRHLVYFGADGKSAGTLDFPKGVKIGFFIMRQHNDYSGFEKSAAQRTMAETGWAYSDPDLNLKYLIDANGGANNKNWTYSNPANVSRGSVRALSWTYDGRLLCGFGDQSNDYDLNDFVWWVDGDVTNNTKVRITTQASSSWIVACEDLGGTFDYDFNDLVFALRKTQIKGNTTKATLELVPLAAGGTLDAKIVYDGSVKGEIHDLIKPGAAIETPLNVDAGTNPVEGTPVLLEEQIDWNADINTIITDNIKVNVIQKKGENATESNYYINTYKKGENSVPQMMILPSGWDWPAEMVPVKDVYAGFATWVADASVATWCTNKNGSRASECVTDPLPDVEIIVTEGEEIVIDPVTPGIDDQLKAWAIDFTESIAILYVGDAKSYSMKTERAESDPEDKVYGNKGNCYSYEVGDASILEITSVGSATVTLNPKKVGRTTLSVTYDDVYDVTHKTTTKIYEVEVRMPELPYANFNVPEVLNVGIGSSITFNVECPVEAEVDKNNLSYEIANTNIVSMSNWGGGYSGSTIYGEAIGQTTIKVKHAFVAGKFLETTKTITVNVTKPIPAFTLQANGAEVSACTLYVGETFNFSINQTSGASGVTYSCESSNSSAASVALSGNNGTITANAEGPATITVTYPESDDYSAKSQTIVVTVKEPVIIGEPITNSNISGTTIIAASCFAAEAENVIIKFTLTGNGQLEAKIADTWLFTQQRQQADAFELTYSLTGDQLASAKQNGVTLNITSWNQFSVAYTLTNYK